MNWLDIALCFILVLSAVAGLRKGLSRELIGLAASVLALILAMWFYHAAGDRLAPYVSSQWAASLAGFLVIFVGVLLAGAALSALVGGLLKTVGLAPLDRVLGGLFGLARGALVSFVAVTVLIAFLPSANPGQLPEAVIESRMVPYLIELSRVVMPLVPRDLKDSFEQRYRMVKSSWMKKAES